MAPLGRQPAAPQRPGAAAKSTGNYLSISAVWHAIKDLIARHVEIIDWHQDADDPTTGSVEIMVFEEVLAGREVGAEKTLNAAAVNPTFRGTIRGISD